ncbi:hypothetical protein NBO_6g0046 [Nosema bombycis CQ1]|uniref:Ricin B lectin n=1 Tax=Nosema bombycis (strain CQ1 / CVCC 102059) TaxID=578461 RepID=R0MBF8_NOSB1|nr:hypothetical protein NBO_6g0046 [Nosema bombycis CQ1]WGJ64372.1 ricin B lectin-like protein [Nosema bombycis]|eukprot:EOB15294.1 hypothetical protein NBO_6g0046 [Nosema bombycis CQ1]
MIKLYFSFLILSIQFKIKHADQNLYLCKPLDKGFLLPSMVPCSNIEEAPNFKFEDNGNGTQQIITEDGIKALGIKSERTGDSVYMGDVEKKQKYQEFIITKVDSDKYTLKCFNMCVTQSEVDYKLEDCDNSSSQLFINVEAEKKPQATVKPKTTVVKPNTTTQTVSNPTINKVKSPTIDQSLLDKMQKTLDETNKLNRKILNSQKRHSKKSRAHLCHHHFHHHHFCEDDEYQIVEKPILIKSEHKAKKHAYPTESERKYLVKETIPITRRDYAIESAHHAKSKNK